MDWFSSPVKVRQWGKVIGIGENQQNASLWEQAPGLTIMRMRIRMRLARQQEREKISRPKSASRNQTRTMTKSNEGIT